MPEFLTADWLANMDAALRASAAPSVAGAPPLVVEQLVTGSPWGDVRYHVVIGPQAAVGTGPACDPDLVFTTDFETARALHDGAATAETSLATGRLVVRGRLALLLEHGAALRALDDVFADARAATPAEQDRREDHEGRG